MEDKGSWHGLDRYLKQATMSMSMDGGEDKKDGCLVVFFFFFGIKKKGLQCGLINPMPCDGNE